MDSCKKIIKVWYNKSLIMNSGTRNGRSTNENVSNRDKTRRPNEYFTGFKQSTESKVKTDKRKNFFWLQFF